MHSDPADAAHVGDALPDTRLNSPASSDNDAVNSAAARVYFGPIQSVEKKRALTSNVGQPTPVRRSMRRSVPAAAVQPGSPRPLAIATGAIDTGSDGEQAEQSSGRETPMFADDMLEEPSSALATKVLRAWDNPSPPPSPPSNAVFLAAEDDAQETGPAEHDGQPTEQESEQALVDGDVLQAEPSDSDVAVEEGEGAQANHRLVEEDLIMFDSFSSPSSGPRMRVLPATPPNPSLRTVDDLLALSPMPSILSNVTVDVLNQTLLPPAAALQAEQRDTTPSAYDEDEVLQTLSRAPSPPPTSPPAGSTSPEEQPLQVPLVILTPTPDPAPQTPVRRSTRARKSTSPFIHPLSVPSADVASPAPSKPRTPSSAATRRRKQGHREALVVEATQSSESEEDVQDGNARAEHGTSAVEIPRSQSLLEELVAELANEVATNPGPQDMASGLAPDPVPLQADDVAPLLILAAGPSTPKTRATRTVGRLGSLSPSSTNMLMQLLPKSSSEVDDGQALRDDRAGPSGSSGAPQGAFLTSPEAPEESSADHAFSFPVPSTPLRPAAPTRANDVARTPARRVLIADAVAQGSLSPEKARAVFASRPDTALAGPSNAPFTPRSPAKRVPIEQAFLASPQKGKTPRRASSPVRSQSVDMARPPAPPPALAGPGHRRSASVDPTTRPSVPPTRTARAGMFRRPGSADSALRPPEASGSSLPFPIATPSLAATRVPEAIAEQDETGVPAPAQHKPAPGPRQSSAKVDSKIPRPGTKPYTRPVQQAGPLRLPAKKLDAKPPAAAAPIAPRPMRMVRKVSTRPVTVESSSDTDSVGVQPGPVPGPGPTTLAHRASTEHTAGALKRKRETAETKPVMFRKVVSTSKANTSTSPAVKPSPTAAAAGPARVQMRRVVGTHRPRTAAATTPTPPESMQNGQQTGGEPPSSGVIEVMSSPVAPDREVQRLPPLSVPAAGTASAEAQSAPEPGPEIQPALGADPEPESEREGATLRRTTRSRRSTQSENDVFGPVARTGGAQQRRKTVLVPDNSAFSGMSVLALKSLTATNTQRNQKQFSAMQTEVVMREGRRPDSPTTKVRNVLEKQREERNLQRQERAARRARKAEGGEAGAEEAGDVSMVTVEEEEQEEELPSGPPTRHLLGPGDEEHYETPERAERPQKRGRFEEDMAVDADSRHQKRVKWDRGLATTVFLSDTPPNPRRPPKEEIAKKGCLAVSAKTLRLDTMGNVLNADVPVPDIVPESIVVKKIVYEDDAEAQPEPASPARSTRSKSKKAKT